MNVIKIFLQFILISIFGIINAQNIEDEKEFERIKPILFDLNKTILLENDYVESSVDSSYRPKWVEFIDVNGVESMFKTLKKESTVEIVQQNFDMIGTKVQSLKLVSKYTKNKSNNLKFKVEIVDDNLKDDKGNQIRFKNLIGLVKGNGHDQNFNRKDLIFNFKDSYESPIKGRVKFKISFLTSYKVIKINDFMKDSIFEFQGAKYKILSFDRNCIKFVGMDSLADSKVQNIEFVNLDKNLKEVVPVEGEDNIDDAYVDSGVIMSTLSSKVSFPEFLLDKKVEQMSYKEYFDYIDLNKKNKNRIIHLIKFNVKIQDLYFYEECYDISDEFEVDLNHVIKIIEN